MWKKRYRDINAWEQYLTDNGFTVVKLFLNLSKEEQRTRFLRRIDLPDHNWKFSAADIKERDYWDAYQKAFSEMLSNTSTEHSPWYVIPADHKWFARLCAGAVIANALIKIDPRFPKVTPEAHDALIETKGLLEAEAPAGAEADPFAAEELAKAAKAESKGGKKGKKKSRQEGQEIEVIRRRRRRGGNAWQRLTRQRPRRRASAERWYALSADDVAGRLGVDPADGLSAAKAAELLQKNGPNALPAEKPTPAWRRFLGQYRSYMQILLLIAGVASLAIGQWSTGGVLILLTVFNAVVGLRQAGKAESAMNALKSLTKQTARVRRDGTESALPAEQVVLGDVVLISAGDYVAADGRIVQASSLTIDESALTGESTPASKGTDALADAELGAGDRTNMAFMNTPVTHGSGVMIVTATGADAEVGKIAGMLATTAEEQTPLMKQLNTMTLWIGAAALGTMIVMFVLGLSRGESAETLFITAIALAIAAIPTALPTVLQVILSAGAKALAAEKAIVKSLMSVETLGSTSAINSDKTGTLTMNQMTAVEVLDPVDRYTISGIGYGLEGKVHHAAGTSASIDDAVLPYIIACDAKLEDGKVVGDPTEGALLVLGHKAGLDIDASRERFPRLATLPFDPTYKLMATFNSATDSSGKERGALLRQGRGSRRDRPHHERPRRRRQTIAWDDDLKKRADDAVTRMEGEGHRVMAAAVRDLDPAAFDAEGDLLGYVTDLEMTSLVAMVDPPREESKAAVRDAQARPHPRAHGDRRRRDHGGRDRQAARHPRRGDAGHGVRRAERGRSG